MKAELRALLAQAGGVSALVPAASIHWMLRVGLPAIRLQVISGSRAYTLDGQADNLHGAVVQIACFARSPAEADKIAKAVEAVVSGHSDATFAGLFIEAVRDGQPEQSGGAAGPQSPTEIHRSDLDIRVRAKAA